MKYFNGIILILLCSLIFSCGKSTDSILSSDKAITAFSFASPAATSVINDSAKTIAVGVPSGTALGSIVATFAVSAGASVSVNGKAQVSGTTANDFTGAVTYVVTAEDGTTVSYVVTVSAGAAALLAIDGLWKGHDGMGDITYSISDSSASFCRVSPSMIGNCQITSYDNSAKTFVALMLAHSYDPSQVGKYVRFDWSLSGSDIVFTIYGLCATESDAKASTTVIVPAHTVVKQSASAIGIVGSWKRTPAAVDYIFNINADASYSAYFLPDAGPDATGTYQCGGDQIWVNDTGAPVSNTGTYCYSIVGNQLTISCIQDPHGGGRQPVMVGLWTRQ